jgi:hypothetical protein
MSRILGGGEEVAMKIAGIVLVVVGLAALLLGGFSYTTDETVLDVGPLEASVEQEETVPIPPILGGIALAAGVALLVMGSRSKA